MQQGRLIVDADWNEQSAIVLNYLRTLAADIIGWHGGPGVTQKDGKPDSGAFVVTLPGNPPAVNVAGGRYYVDGIQIELLDEGYKGEDINRASGLQNRIVIVDVWEQHIAAVSNSSILDPALNGLDSPLARALVSDSRSCLRPLAILRICQRPRRNFDSSL